MAFCTSVAIAGLFNFLDLILAFIYFSSSSLQKTWLAIVIVVVGTSLFFDTTSASFIDGTCRGVMGNRDIYKKVVRVCEDCTNIFRLPGLDGMCRYPCTSFLRIYVYLDRHI